MLFCQVAAGQPAPGTPGAGWQCSAVGSGAAVLMPGDRLAGVVNRFAALYSTRVLGLVQAKDRVYLLGTGGFSSRLALRAEVPSASPSRYEFVSQSHDFRLEPGDARATAAGFVCLLATDAGRHGLARDGQGEIALAAGASVSLFDPADPTLTVELKAAESSPMSLREIAALSGRVGIYAGLMRSRGQRDASIAVQAADGRIAFRAVPESAPPAETRGTVILAVTAVEAEPPAPPKKPAVAAAMKPAPAPAPAAVAPAEPVPVDIPPVATASRDDSYEKALRKLAERQGGSVRSVSALTQVHPAVDAYRNLMRLQ